MSFDVNQPAYQALRQIVAERTRPILAWVGSGLSASAGVPTWFALKQTLVETLEETAETLEAGDRKERLAQVRAIREERNYWVAFQRLETALGRTTYRDTIKGALAPAATVGIPDTYRRLWQLGIRGLLNLNLDRFATRALAEKEVGTALAEFDGKDVAKLRGVLTGHRPFIANLHGTADVTSSWVFTHSALNELLADEAYRSFIEVCFSSHTVLFLGLTVDDFAVGGHLERLSALGIETDSHYWLTHRRDSKTDKWAEDAGIRVIRYRSDAGDHGEVEGFFDDLRSFVPPDDEEPAPPVSVSTELVDVPDAALPPPDELASWQAEDIRRILNAHAVRLLSDGDETAYAAYEEFCNTYDEPIYRAWYARARTGADDLLGYKLRREAARGAFGTVFEASDPNGCAVAVKLLHEEVHSNTNLLKSFRRGVRSMRILQERQVAGMAAYQQASEIPAFVVMDWINGPNLTEAVRSQQLPDWADVLRVGAELADVIRRAHALPERVLHRDLRPSNVMLESFYTDPQGWSVTVLDFDLSWHRGAFEQSVVHTTAVGYLAPEQIGSVTGVSTRNAAVDSFGLGMTLLFLCTGVDPLPDQHRHRDWDDYVSGACGTFGPSEWKSLPRRFARLVLFATADAQSARWDMTDITNELQRLRDALLEPDSVDEPELLAEELAARSQFFADYEWSSDKLSAVRESPTGLTLSLLTDLRGQCVVLRIEWNSTGVEQRSGLGKYIKANAAATADQLRAGAFRDVQDKVQQNSVYISAKIDTQSLRGRIQEVAEVIDTATRKLNF